MEQNDELKHYGIPGMKWGQRKIEKLTNTQNKLIKDKRIASKKYINVSNKLYLAKKNEELKKAKQNKDTVKIQNLKYDIKDAKAGKKYGSNYLDGNKFRQIYKYSGKTKEGAAISIVSNTNAYNKERVASTLKKIGGVSITVAATAPIWYPKVESGINFLKKTKLNTIKYNWKTGMLTGLMK